MGEFTRQVQSDKVPGPLRRKFTPAGWKKQFESFAEPDEQDQNVYAAALVIHEKLENIRSQLKLSTSATLSATTKLRAFVAAVNHHILVAQSKSEAAITELGARRAAEQPEGFRVEELTSVKLELPGGFEWSPAEIVESLIDGIEIPVRFSLAASPDLAGNPRMDQVEWKDIRREDVSVSLDILFGYNLVWPSHERDFRHNILGDNDRSQRYWVAGLSGRNRMSAGQQEVLMDPGAARTTYTSFLNGPP